MNGIQVAEQATDLEYGVHAPVSLVVPCKAEYMAMCRLAAGAVGTCEALDEEAIADLKVVVTEACTCFLNAETVRAVSGVGETGPSSLCIDFNVTPEAWEITIRSTERGLRILTCDESEPISEDRLGLTIINALADSVEHIHSDAEGSVLRLTKRLTGGSEPIV